MEKVIHYCWFGKGKKPNIIEKCMESWTKICSDFKIVEWNEDNFDVNICPYVKQAYEAKKYAFVSDYARFYVLNKFGGVYLDTDVELVKSIEPLLESNFTGFESNDSVATGLIMACEKDNELCKAMLEDYNNDKFVLDDGTLNLKTVCERTTDWLVSKGLRLDNTKQEVADYIIYPSEYFNPKGGDYGKEVITENTYSIHHYLATWKSPLDRKIMEYKVKYGVKKGKILFILRHPILALKKAKMRKI